MGPTPKGFFIRGAIHTGLMARQRVHYLGAEPGGTKVPGSGEQRTVEERPFMDGGTD